MTIKQRVEKLLEQNKSLRDSDKKLIWSYWIVYDKAMPEDNTKLELALFMDRCTTPESITRARREVMEKREDLRGSEWVQEQRARKEMTKGGFINKELSSELDEALGLKKPEYREDVQTIRDQYLFRK
jgi:hypothetical protein